MDLSNILPYAVSICTIAASLVTIWLNNRHSAKMKELDHKHELYKSQYLHEREMIENYLSSAGKYIYHPKPRSLDEYNSAYLGVLFLVPEDIRNTLVQINREIGSRENSAIETHLAEVAGDLRNYLNRGHLPE